MMLGEFRILESGADAWHAQQLDGTRPAYDSRLVSELLLRKGVPSELQ